MKDADCTEFLQWALPRLGMRWLGFRRVRGQVCKRLRRRMAELELRDVADYRALLETDPEEWTRLDGLCRISISRFYRDQGVWRTLECEVLPRLAERARARGETRLRIWSALTVPATLEPVCGMCRTAGAARSSRLATSTAFRLSTLPR